MRLEANIEELAMHRGPFFEHWYRSCRAAFEFEAVEGVR
jgi:hypothetical protein